MIDNLKIPCPTSECNSQIDYNVAALIGGASFGCQKCSAQIKIAGSSISDLKTTYEKFLQLKNNLSKK
jgi:hypothetical protein